MLVETEHELLTSTFFRRSRATPKLLSEGGLFGFSHNAHIQKSP
jgi:hypothetical protein